jgi:hypothetical protein
MPGLVPGIHVFVPIEQEEAWMAGSSPAMTGLQPCKSGSAKTPSSQTNTKTAARAQHSGNFVTA